MNLAKRFKNYIFRFCKFSGIIKPAYKGPFYFAARHINTKHPFSLSYKKHAFIARNIDYSAIREIFFEKEYAFLLPYLEKTKAPVILDIGAHIGLFSLWIFEHAPHAKVISVEASPDTYKILEKNNLKSIEKHSFDWQIMHRAAWKNNDTLNFAGTGDAMSHQISDNGNTQVRGITLKELISFTGRQKIDLMKIDIEGAEESFVCENPDLLQNIDSLVIELHAKYCDTARVQNALRSQYAIIRPLSERTSSKTVLYCTRD